MRKDTKRSLLMWPLVASSIISAGIWIQDNPDSVDATLAEASRVGKIAKTHIEREFGIELEFSGSVLSRLATTVGYPSDFESDVVAPHRQPEPIVQAPLREENRELAGLNLELDALVREAEASGLLQDLSSTRSVAPLKSSLQRKSSLKRPVALTTRPAAVSEPSAAQPSQSLGSMRRRDQVAAADLQNALGPQVLELLPTATPSTSPTRLSIKPTPTQETSSSKTSVAEVTSGDSGTHVGDLPRVAKDVQETLKQSANNRNTPAGWPGTPQLDQALQTVDNLASKPESRLAASMRQQMTSWTENVRRATNTLENQPRLGEPEVESVLAELKQLAQDGLEFGETIQDDPVRVEMLIAAHAVNRRVAVWQPIYTLSRQETGHRWMVTDEPETSSIDRYRQSLRVLDALRVVKADLDATGDTNAWNDFLMLDRLYKVARNSSAKREVIAQQFLSRLQWHTLDEEQIRWLERDSVIQLANAVRPWTSSAIDYAELLRQIERQETDAIDLAAVDIASAIQSLRFSDQPQSTDVAKSLNQHYRNANVRIALTDDILNRLLPEVAPKTVPVRTRILGTNVRGVSQIQSQLAISLTPSIDRWTLNLQTKGDVSTRSTGLNGPVALRTSGASQFLAQTPIEVTPHGFKMGDVDVDVHGRTKLRGIRSDYDGWPLIGALVRSVANREYDAKQWRSNQIASNMIRNQVASEMEGELDGRIDQARDKLSNMVLGPLGKLRLDPQVVDMQTTNERLIARYRLAGDWQLGAFTPRPRAPRTSLMSVQTHQSAINNFLEQLIPRDQEMTIQEIVGEAASVFGREVQLAGDIPDDITIQFARTRPITAEIEDGRVWLTMRIVKLKRDKGRGLTNFIVRAAYRPEVNRLQASLVRDGHLRISGPGMSMRERLPIRTVFNKVLSPERTLPLTLPELANHRAMEGLAISQLELRDGWIGLAISQESAPKIAWEVPNQK